MDRLRLAPDVVPEPLVLAWYAWPRLPTPATGAMDVAVPWLEFVMALKCTDEARPIAASNGLIADCHERGLVAERLCAWKESLYR